MIGETVGNYVVERLVDQGSMGAVYLAHHPRLGRQVAIKVLHAHRVIDPKNVKRFANEAVAASRIGNQHIVEVVDFGQRPDGTPYLIMEWLEGESLGDRLDRLGKLPLPVALAIAGQIGEALAASHACGIIHRDLKPDNIFLIRQGESADFVKVLDFGLAKLSDGSEERVSVTGETVGTPAYMSPEQCSGDGRQAIDHRADIYALGIIVYRMILGRLPFDASGVGPMLVAHMVQNPIAPRHVDPQLPVHIDRTLLEALQKKPEHRPPSITALLAGLQGRQSGARGARSWLRWSLGAAAAGALGVAALLFWPGRTPPTHAGTPPSLGQPATGGVDVSAPAPAADPAPGTAPAPAGEPAPGPTAVPAPQAEPAVEPAPATAPAAPARRRARLRRPRVERPVAGPATPGTAPRREAERERLKIDRTYE